MSKKSRKLIIFGNRKTAKVAYEYFSEDSEYEVSGFTVEKEFIKEDKFLDLPLVTFENIEKHYQNDEYSIFIAIVFNDLNRLRERIANAVIKKGYNIASYISQKAVIAKSAKIADGCFILPGCIVEPFAEIGKNVFLWSGSQISHHTKIADNCFISPKVTIAGNCNIGRNSFLGVGSVVCSGVSIGGFSWVQPGVIVKKDLPAKNIAMSSGYEILDEKRLSIKVNELSTRTS